MPKKWCALGEISFFTASLGVMTDHEVLRPFDGIELDGLQFAAKVYELFEFVRQSPDGTTRLRLRPSLVEKRLLEELLPIAAYVQRHYRAGRYIHIRWHSGSQPFDAELRQRGAYVDHGYFPASAYLEVTNIVHPKEHMQREHLEKKGGTFGLEGIRRLPGGDLISEPVVYSGQDFVEYFGTLVVKEIEKKAAKPYPENTSLVVQCILNTLYTQDDWDLLMTRVRDSASESGFREVFFHDPTQNYMLTCYPRK
jgi:hypothetical protein